MHTSSSSPSTGVWLIGARGSVATTAITGALALRAGLATATGCVTDLPELRHPLLPGWDDLVFGGHDIVDLPLVKKAEALGAAGVVPAHLAASLAGELAKVEQSLRPLPGSAEEIARDIADFRDRHRLARVVVINVASTEPVPAPHPAFDSLETLSAMLADGGVTLPPSALAAYAAFSAGCPFVDFTPSVGARLPAVAELGRRRGLCWAGNDGKTGETLVKSVLAPMFAIRNLQVRSWSGLNLLGGGDGARLTDPGANAAKSASKQRVLGEALGYQPQGQTRIDYVEELGDFKTAWDLITFSGFLGAPMRLEFTWHGIDSALAAPLVLDLARLVSASHAAGISGELADLAFFFKDPLGAAPAGLADQWSRLTSFVAALPGAA
jgi:myo-inositol-1-phosphate synthase